MLKVAEPVKENWHFNSGLSGRGKKAVSLTAVSPRYFGFLFYWSRVTFGLVIKMIFLQHQYTIMEKYKKIQVSEKKINFT